MKHLHRYNESFETTDQLIQHLNTLYDNITIKNRLQGNPFYDIHYIVGSKDKYKIHIGTYDINKKIYHLWECENISDYCAQGIDDLKTHHQWSDELSEESFDRFVSKWHDIYDNL
jgi:hypothetical protein